LCFGFYKIIVLRDTCQFHSDVDHMTRMHKHKFRMDTDKSRLFLKTDSSLLTRILTGHYLVNEPQLSLLGTLVNVWSDEISKFLKPQLSLLGLNYLD
jgi:hypothetical protein